MTLISSTFTSFFALFDNCWNVLYAPVSLSTATTSASMTNDVTRCVCSMSTISGDGRDRVGSSKKSAGCWGHGRKIKERTIEQMSGY